MKKLIMTLLLIGICGLTQGADSTITEPQPKYRGGGDGYGLMALGGVTLAIGGFVTRPDRYYNGTTWVDKPFYNQGPRASAIVCGVSLTVTGLISAILK
jgi:hypothetical protein